MRSHPRKLEWVVYAKPPFGGPEQVLAYLGRYTHRVAISNTRLVSLSDGQVAFRWKDYRHHGHAKLMTLAADEFIRRFLLHTLPDGFHRIRHYGFLANGHRAQKLALCRRLLDAPATPAPTDTADDKAAAQARCPCCGGVMWRTSILSPVMPRRSLAIPGRQLMTRLGSDNVIRPTADVAHARQGAVVRAIDCQLIQYRQGTDIASRPASGSCQLRICRLAKRHQPPEAGAFARRSGVSDKASATQSP